MLNTIRWFLRLIRNRRFTAWRKVQILFGWNSADFTIKESGEGQYIYALIDPVSLRIFYIGRSNNPGRRFVEHFNEFHGTDKGKRIQKIKKRLHIPYMIILEQCDSGNVRKQEKYWIKKFGGKRRLENMKE